MKHIVKIMTFLVAITATWISLLQAAIIPQSHTWLLPLYFIVSLGCYGLFMVGVGLMQFPTCPQEAILLQQSCTKVAVDFVSPENIKECIRLTEEFRKLPINHKAREDKLEIKKMILHAMHQAVTDFSELTNRPENVG